MRPAPPTHSGPDDFDAALDCDDQDACTADSCDAISGCVDTPIVPCSPAVPTSSTWGLGLLMPTAGIMLVGVRREQRPLA